MQFHSAVLSLKTENGHHASTQGGEETVWSLLPGREGLEEEMDLSQETKRKEMGLGKQAEDRVKWEKNPPVQKSGAFCNVGTFKQPHSFCQASFPRKYFKLVL